jgi:hypothetical protein
VGLDHVAAEAYLTLRFEHEQQHADVLARDLGAKPGMTNEWAGNDLHRSPILGFFRPRFVFGRSMAPSRSRARSASMSGTCTGSSLPILTSRITPGHCFMQFDAGEAVAGKVWRLKLMRRRHRIRCRADPR